MFRAQRDLSHRDVFHFVTNATTEKRGPGYECAGKPVAARRPLVHARAGANVCKRTHVLPLGSIAASVLRSVAQRLRLQSRRRGQSLGMAVIRTHGKCASLSDARRDVMYYITYLRSFARNEEAQDLIEYALLVGLISLVAVVAIGLAGGSVNTIFTTIQGKLASAV
jgi:pilus assembly protein Flp/PilA